MNKIQKLAFYAGYLNKEAFDFNPFGDRKERARQRKIDAQEADSEARYKRIAAEKPSFAAALKARGTPGSAEHAKWMEGMANSPSVQKDMTAMSKQTSDAAAKASEVRQSEEAVADARRRSAPNWNNPGRSFAQPMQTTNENNPAVVQAQQRLAAAQKAVTPAQVTQASTRSPAVQARLKDLTNWKLSQSPAQRSTSAAGRTVSSSLAQPSTPAGQTAVSVQPLLSVQGQTPVAPATQIRAKLGGGVEPVPVAPANTQQSTGTISQVSSGEGLLAKDDARKRKHTALSDASGMQQGALITMTPGARERVLARQ